MHGSGEHKNYGLATHAPADPELTMTRQRLEDVITRQLVAQRDRSPGSFASSPLVAASRRAILAAIDDWAASQPAAITPPAVITIRGTLTPRALQRLRAQLAKALDATTGGTR